MLKFRPVFGAVVTRSRTFLRGGERCSSPLPPKFDRVCCDVIKRRVAWFLHQGVGCNMSEGSEERLMDQNQDLNQDRDQDRDLKRSERGGEEEEQIQATKRRRTTAEDQKQEQEQKQERDQDQDGDNRKCPKKKVALLMAYSGKGYYGMQVQTGGPAPQLQVCPSGSVTVLSCVSEEPWERRVQDHRRRPGQRPHQVRLHP